MLGISTNSSTSIIGRGWATNVGVTPGAWEGGAMPGGGGVVDSGVTVWSILGRLLAVICFITSLKDIMKTCLGNVYPFNIKTLKV